MTPGATVRVVPARLLLLCLLLRSSWLTVEGRRHGAARVLHRRGRRAALAVSVSVGWRRSNSNSRRLVATLPSSRVDAVVSRRRRDASSSSAATANLALIGGDAADLDAEAASSPPTGTAPAAAFWRTDSLTTTPGPHCPVYSEGALRIALLLQGAKREAGQSTHGQSAPRSAFG